MNTNNVDMIWELTTDIEFAKFVISISNTISGLENV